MVSLSRSSAHMPRVILRTVEPAKLLACQSVEKRCTRMKASRATSDMIRSVNGTIACSPIRRSTIEAKPSATMAPKATIAAWRAAMDRTCRGVRASTRWPENTGMNRSATVAPEQAAGDDGGAAPAASASGGTRRAAPRGSRRVLVARAVMASSGCGLAARAGSIVDARHGSGPAQASLKNDQ